MKEFRYIDGKASLTLDKELCIGCGNCVTVCPHRVFRLQGNKAVLQDFNGCIECGGCASNCPVQAISVNPGVGCAAYIIARWINKISGRNLLDGCC